MPDLIALRLAAQRLLPTGTGIGTADPRADHPAFEGEAISGLPTRLSEFRAGRIAARAAMADLGLTPAAIPMAEDRSPIWPAGLCGSISHSSEVCLAAVALQSGLRGIGVDLELATPLEPDLRDTILRPEERHHSDMAAKLIFCAKEAAYKAQYGISRCLFDFHVLSVTLNAAGFTARFTEEITPFAKDTLLQGRHARVAGHFLCVVTL